MSAGHLLVTVEFVRIWTQIFAVCVTPAGPAGHVIWTWTSVSGVHVYTHWPVITMWVATCVSVWKAGVDTTVTSVSWFWVLFIKYYVLEGNIMTYSLKANLYLDIADQDMLLLILIYLEALEDKPRFYTITHIFKSEMHF